MAWLKRFLTDESGSTAVEYAVMLALLLMACIAAISVFGQGSGGMWSGIDTELGVMPN
jgi:pilus assembly protein Flp/PilA